MACQENGVHPSSDLEGTDGQREDAALDTGTGALPAPMPAARLRDDTLHTADTVLYQLRGERDN